MQVSQLAVAVIAIGTSANPIIKLTNHYGRN